MATFQDRENGTVTARVRRHGVTKSETFTAKADAEAWARKVESEIERGLWRDSTEAERTSLDAALNRYEKEVAPKKKGAVQEVSVIGILRGSKLAKQSLARTSGGDIAKLLEQWERDGLAPATIHRRLAVLSRVFTIARKRWGMSGLANPCQDIEKPKVNNARERRVSDEEIEAVCRVSRSTFLPTIVRLAVETAMRRGEIVGLEWKHVDLKDRVAHLPDTKNGMRRDVPLSSRAIAALKYLPRNISGRVFNCRHDAVTLAFSRAVARARTEYEVDCTKKKIPTSPDFLSGLTFHDLRHEAITRLAPRWKMEELMKVTGHQDSKMLIRYYHPLASDLAKKLD